MYLLFDIGGTKMRIAASEDGVGFEEPMIIQTPELYADGIMAFKRLADEVLRGRKAKAIAGGIAGPFSERKASLVGSPNLGNWIGKPFRQDLEALFGAPVYTENDSAMVGLGEAVYGAGRGFDIVAYITVSTGVGGVRIVKGAIDEKTVGFEPGHQIIDADRTMVPDADGPYLGGIISGKAVAKRAGKSPKEISDAAFWDETAKYLAYGLNNTVVHWSPDVVVLGGSMIMGNPAIPVDRVEAHLKDILKIFPELPVIRKSELGDVGGLWGALDYIAKQLRL